MSQQAKHIYEFGPFRIDPIERLLRQDGRTVSLTPKAFDLLLALVKNCGHLLEKEELMRQLWPDSFVEEANLSRNVFTLRKALGESEDGSQYIETVPKRGYRFVARVTTVLDENTNLIVEERFKSHLVLKKTEETTVTDRVDEGAEHTREQALTALLKTRRVPSWRQYQVAIVAPLMLAGLAVALSYFGIERQRKQSAPSAIAKHLAVLPFKSIGTLGSDEDLLLGMADTLIIKLSNVNRIVVRPTNAVRRYIGQNQDSVAAGRELGVDAVLDGSIRMQGDRILVSVQLINVGDGVTLLADKFEEKFTNIFTVEDLITERVATALILKLTGKERGQLAKRYTENAEAYRLYMLGRYYSEKMTQTGWEKGIDYFEQAINKDRDYALAYVGLADCYNGLGWSGLLPLTEVRQKREAAAVKAIEIDNTLAEAHLALSAVKSDAWDWAAAESRLKLALKLNPNSAGAHQAYASHLDAVGRFDEGLAEIKRAQQLDPTSLSVNAAVGMPLYFAGRNDEAIEEFKKAIDMDPYYAPAHTRLGMTYAQKGMYEEAIAELKQARALDNSKQRKGRFAYLAYVYAVSGRRAQAQEMLAELNELSKLMHVSPANFAIIYTGLGEKDQAFAWLHKANEMGYLNQFLKVDPVFDSLHSDPRFSDLLRRMNLAPSTH